VRFRLDGVLHEISQIPKNAYPQVVSRIKVIAKLNVAEKRLPQDGRIRVKIGNKELDMRVSTLPTVFGERIVIRLLDKSNKILTLEELGFSRDDLEKYERIIKKPHGLVLITGPTGSGKSTTLYASLLKLKTPRKNIITIEDPVEYQINGISQIQVNPKINLTFANGLRSILRQDPDIIMVGEIRDLETAEIAIHASMTGHLVLSTLHTNDAPSAVARLVDMGVEPFLIASSLEGVIAQRLVRRVCENCKEEKPISETEYQEIKKYYPGILKEISSLKTYRGKGCDECLGTGYKGRVAIYEIMEIDDEIRGLISKNVETNILRERAMEKGMKTLVQDGIQKVLKGITTLEEVLQVAQV
jgi:general secretion pathway protein E